MDTQVTKADRARRGLVARSFILLSGTLGFGLAGLACSAAGDAQGERAMESSSAIGVIKPVGLAPVSPQAWTGPLGAVDLEKWYSVPTNLASGATVAIIAQFADDGTFETNLGTYRSKYALPVCTQANQCLKKVTVGGLPANTSPYYSSPVDLSLDMASAGCPTCKLLLVEMSGANESDFVAAAQTAFANGASVAAFADLGWFEAPPPPTLATLDKALAAANVPLLFVSAGSTWDTLTSNWPVFSSSVISVASTTITRDSNPDGSGVGGSEDTWYEAQKVAVCVDFEAKPAWQKDTACTSRTASDVSAVGDPVWAVTANGWVTASGPQVPTALVAAIFAQTGNGHASPSYPYVHSSAFQDINTGAIEVSPCVDSNSWTSAPPSVSFPPYMCESVAGYDALTGVGTPIGTAMAGIPLNLFYVGSPANPGEPANLTNELTVSPGLTSQNSIPITAGGTWATRQTLSLSFSNLPDGVSVSLTPMQAADPGGMVPWANISLVAQVNAPPEQRLVTVTGTANGVTHQTQFEAVVQPCVATITCANEGATCGTLTDNCGNTLSCGACAAGDSCSSNVCCPTGETYSAAMGECVKPIVIKQPPISCGGKGQGACQ